MAKINLTFKDLQDYIQTAERDDVGMHFPCGGDSNNLPLYGFHICGNLRQSVGLCKRSDDGSVMNSIANFIFDGDEVSMVYVNESVIADYGNAKYFPIDTPIDNQYGIKLFAEQIDAWKTHLGKMSGVIQEVLRDVLWPVVSKQ